MFALFLNVASVLAAVFERFRANNNCPTQENAQMSGLSDELGTDYTFFSVFFLGFRCLMDRSRKRETNKEEHRYKPVLSDKPDAVTRSPQLFGFGVSTP